jgi:murein DD-endopeptidase MepM/ murein hydrolase activator NlpD
LPKIKDEAKRPALYLALIALVSVPGMVYAKGQSEKIARLPEVVEIRNSQTMDLLEGYLNTNPTGTVGSDLAIADNTALVYAGDETGSFTEASKTGGEIVVYTVKPGDTLSSISKLYDVSVNTIVWANDIKGGKIKPGQELVILPVTGVRHTIKKGDTIKSIAALYKADEKDILAYNGLAVGDKLTAGEAILVPDGQISTSSKSPSTTKKASSLGTAINNIVGNLMRPISGGTKSQGIHGYNAVDLAAPRGTPVYAADDGTVAVSRAGGYNGGYGTYVVIKHANGTQTLYGHMDSDLVSVGETVKRGQQIGTIGMTGRTTGPHVHFEVRGGKNPF